MVVHSIARCDRKERVMSWDWRKEGGKERKGASK